MNLRPRLCAVCITLLSVLIADTSFADTADSASLIKAAEAGDLQVIKRELVSGVSVDTPDAEGWTALMYAASEGKLASVKALLQAGANVNATSNKGQTPLMAAAISGNTAIVKLLLSKGADKSAVSAQGLTAAEVAHRSKFTNLAKMLEPKGVAKVEVAATPPVETQQEVTPEAQKLPVTVPKKSHTAESSQVEGLVNTAASSFQAGRYTEAAQQFQKIVTIDPRHALAWHFLGQSLWKTGDNEGARSAYEKSLEITPTGDLANRNKEFLAKLPGKIFKDCADCPEMIPIPDKNYAIGKFEMTQGQWKAIMGNNPSYFKDCGDNCPVEQVSWNDTQEFIQKLNAKTGKQYRLPTTAEWYFACRAGVQQENCHSDNIDSVAWYDGNSGNKSHPVGQKQSNAWGFYDMSGNVWEWVQDRWDDKQDWRNLHGRSWRDAPTTDWHDSFRHYPAGFRDLDLGFRVARTLP